MRKHVLFLSAATLAITHSAFAASATTCSNASAPNYSPSVGGFGTLDGQIYDPAGNVWRANGINVDTGNLGNASQILAAFPGLNFIRLAVVNDGPSSLPNPATFQSFISTMTAHGVVVEIEDHPWGSGPNPQPNPYQGTQLAQETAWYAAAASMYKSNPYVWFGAMNEPENGPGIQAQVEATYKAIRGAGNNNIIMMQAGIGGGNPQTVGDGGGYGGPGSAYTAAGFSNMTNVAWDLHFYGGWGTNNTTSVSALQAALYGSASSHTGVAATQTIKSSNGTIPVIVGETGQYATDITDGTQVLQAAFGSSFTSGAVAWAWNPTPGGGAVADDLTDGSGNLTSYGKIVAGYIASSGASGCPESPIPPIPTSPEITDAQNAFDALKNLSVADVANLASQGLTANGQNIGGIANFAIATGSDPAALLTDPNTAAVLSSGTLNPLHATPRTAASPSGTMPTPNPVSQSGSFTVSGDYTTTAAPSGNDTGSISGTGNNVMAAGGIQTVTITGVGNTLTTGPYDDTVTVQSGGNTIDTGGGNDTVVLAYGGVSPSTAINIDAPAATSLGSAGNTIILPAPGTGVLTIKGTLGSADRVDVSRALAGTTWDHSPATMWNYISALATSSGCTISVGGQVIAVIPNGSPSGNIGPFVIAH